MSRRTERPYKVDGADRLAQHSEVRCSVPEINGPVVQQEFTSLLRETCNPSPPAMAGAAVSNGCRAGAGVSRGHSTGSNEPENSTGRTHNSGRAELGRQTRPSVVLSRSDEAESAELRAAIIVAEKECCVIPQGLPGTAVRGPACTVVWEPGGAKPSRRPDWMSYFFSSHTNCAVFAPILIVCPLWNLNNRWKSSP